jgi:hypothetical protein
LRPPYTAKSDLPAFHILVLPYGDRQIRPAAGRDEEQPAYRIMPQNLEAGQGLSGTLMLDNRALEKVTFPRI